MKKTNFLTIFSFILLLAVTLACNKKPVQEGIQTTVELKKLLADPPSEYRSAPLWDWNDQISEEGIDFQMKE
ncbi:MAG: hypothetical protein WCI54_19335, partial [Bacteroidia bacterium]